jgi:5-methylcytosine-specific restriction enzyme A
MSPMAPLRPCLHPGCPALVPKGRCADHSKEFSTAYSRERGSSSARGYDREWQRVRLQVLKRDSYLCQDCLKRDPDLVTAAEVVDHIKAFRGKSDPLRLDLKNLRSLCHGCHNVKSNIYDGTGFQSKRKKEATPKDILQQRERFEKLFGKK